MIWEQRRIDAARPEPTSFGVPTALATSRVRCKISPNFILALRQFSRRETSARPSTWKGGNAFGSIEPQVTTTSKDKLPGGQRLNRCSGYVLLMQFRLPIRPVPLPQSCVGGANALFLTNRRHIVGALPMPLSPVDRLLAERARQISQIATRERA